MKIILVSDFLVWENELSFVYIFFITMPWTVAYHYKQP